jgi:hypothetical protein
MGNVRRLTMVGLLLCGVRVFAQNPLARERSPIFEKVALELFAHHLQAEGGTMSVVRTSPSGLFVSSRPAAHRRLGLPFRTTPD